MQEMKISAKSNSIRKQHNTVDSFHQTLNVNLASHKRSAGSTVMYSAAHGLSIEDNSIVGAEERTCFRWYSLSSWASRLCLSSDSFK